MKPPSFSNLFTAHAWIRTPATHVSARSKFTRESMSHALRPRSRGRTRLGILSGRLRGGFLASPLPGNSSTSTSNASDDSDSVFGDLQTHTSTSSQDVSFTSTEDTSLQSIMRVLRSIHATTSRLEQKLVTVEEKQMKLSDSFKELNSIVRKQEKDNFSIKGSSLEV